MLFACQNQYLKGVFNMKKNFTFATDIVISRASLLPDRLMIDTESIQGQLALTLLLDSDDTQLKELSKEASKIKEENFFLSIFEISEKYLGKSCPVEIRDRNFDFSRISKVLFNGSTCPLVQKYGEPCRYVTVTLVTK